MVLIAAMSGRALAQSARRGGFVPLVADLFADDDTAAAAEDTARLDALDAAHLLPALARLAQGRAPAGIVCGSGFEDRPGLLGTIAAHYRIIGNDEDTVRRAKDPDGFAALCAAHGVPHPAIRHHAPDAADAADWLVKQAGGAGGTHIADAVAGAAPGAGRYFQQRAAGVPVGVLFAADGTRARILGASRQWTDPVAGMPMRYGGAVQPHPLPAPVAAEVWRALAALVPALGLRGLGSADLLVDGDDWRLIEINPRPGATMDLYAAWPLFAWHVAACEGSLRRGPAPARGATAAAFAYARRDIVLPAGFAWPDWTADRQPPGMAARAGEPLCSVLAAADDPVTAEADVRRRVAAVLAAAEEATCPSA
ncbi:hypothetical protein Asru_0153_03 [Acidisphaera rubrifaciens HS-AP3]|uniref:ATP-grasp domain-containing protein n=1 Tax=Acidisphaera rubrifaciens HS-AP3 TaxID=1231350 RepID=A0A0D6P4Z7_9PROT|nr:hypothetical protein Asru_0153_03 [Acidisphaera rubrifaciens HS-AP3]